MRRSTAVFAALVLLAALPATAVAAPPANDLPGGAITIPAIPGSISQVTLEATVSPAEDVGCGSGGQDQATVWYRITPAVDTNVVIDATGSDYDAGVNVFAAAPTADALLTCFSGAPGFAALTGGTTYYVMFADIDAGDNGGDLEVTLSVAPPPITLTGTVDPLIKIADKGRTATVSGTIQCDVEATFAGVDLGATQRVGKYEIRASGFGDATCGPQPSPWFAELFAENGRFAGGKVNLSVHFFACDAVGQCTEVNTTLTVRTRK